MPGKLENSVSLEFCEEERQLFLTHLFYFILGAHTHVHVHIHRKISDQCWDSYILWISQMICLFTDKPWNDSHKIASTGWILIQNVLMLYLGIRRAFSDCHLSSTLDFVYFKYPGNTKNYFLRTMKFLLVVFEMNLTWLSSKGLF